MYLQGVLFGEKRRKRGDEMRVRRMTAAGCESDLSGRETAGNGSSGLGLSSDPKQNPTRNTSNLVGLRAVVTGEISDLGESPGQKKNTLTKIDRECRHEEGQPSASDHTPPSPSLPARRHTRR